MHTQCNYDANADWRCLEMGKQRSPLLIYCSELLLATALASLFASRARQKRRLGHTFMRLKNYRCVLPK
jgi:hypothetical protein